MPPPSRANTLIKLAPKRESDQAANRHVMPDRFCRRAYRRSRRKGAQADHEQTGYRAAVKAMRKAAVARVARRLRRTHIRNHCDAHPDETGREGAKRADYKTNRRGMIFENEKQHENDRGDHADRDDLPIQICFCALLDCGRNLYASVRCPPTSGSRSRSK